MRLLGREEEALTQIQEALALDPLSLVINMEAGLPYYFMRRNEEAIRCYQKALDLDPNFSQAHINMGWAYEAEGDYQQAIVELETAARLDATTPALGALGRVYGLAGRTADALRIRHEVEQRLTPALAAPAFALGQIDMSLGEYDKAMDWFERSSREHYWGVLWMYACPRWDRLRPNPRFVALVRSMNLPATP